MDRNLFRFRIDAFTPDTIPMKRLAEYMLELAKLMGEHEHVHFRQVKRGSAVLVQEVNSPAMPKVRQRLAYAGTADAPDDLRRLFRKVDTMLIDDRASATMLEVGKRTPILRFPGRTGTENAIGPIVQDGYIQGELVRVGGEDKTAHALIRDNGETFSCEVTREMARVMGNHLYAPVRMNGRGRWLRNSQGKWTLLSFKAVDFVPLQNDDLVSVVERLRQLPIERGQVSADDLLKLRRA